MSKFAGYVVCNDRAEYAIDARSVPGGVLRGWSRAPEKGLRFLNEGMAEKWMDQFGVSNGFVAELWDEGDTWSVVSVAGDCGFGGLPS